MRPAFSQDFLKRLSAFSKLSSGSTITLVTRNSPLSHSPEALPVYHAPLPVATGGRNPGVRSYITTKCWIVRPDPPLAEQRGEDESDDGHQLDEDVHAGARGVFEGVAHGVAHHGGLVRLRALAAEVAGLDVFLRVVPGAARVRHEEREEDAHQRRAREEAPERFLAHEEADNGGQHDCRQA